MAESEPVKVAVDIVDEFSDDLRELEAKLEKIDGKQLDVDLEIDDNGQIEEIKAKLEALEKDLSATLEIDIDDAAARARRASLQRDMDADLNINPKGGTLSSLGGKRATDGFWPAAPPGDTLRTPTIGDGDDDTGGSGSIPGASFMRSISKATSASDDLKIDNKIYSDVKIGSPSAQVKTNGMDASKFFPDGSTGSYPWLKRGTMGTRVRRAPGSARRAAGRAGRSVKGAAGGLLGKLPDKPGSGIGRTAGDTNALKQLGSKIKDLFPKYRTWINLISAIIPMLITMAGAALGAAAALGGIAVGGGAVLGLGLMGYGENAAESMDMLKAKINEVKGELFQALQPAMEAMNPIVDQFLDGIGPAASRLAGPLEELAAYEGFLSNIGSGFVDFLVRFIELVGELRPQIEAVGGVLGNIFGSLLLDLFEWAVKEIHNNMDAFIQLGSILGSLVVVLYNVSKAASFLIAPLAPLFELVAGLSGLLNNKLIRFLMMTAVATAALAGTMYGLSLAVSAVAAGAIGSALSSMKAMVVMLYELFYSSQLAAMGMTQLARAIAMTGVGALLVGGGVLAAGAIGGQGTASQRTGGQSGFGGMGRGGGSGATVNIYGDVGNSEYQKMKDNFGNLYENEVEIQEGTEK